MGKADQKSAIQKKTRSKKYLLSTFLILKIKVGL
jgi:hypothetical protein